jgi:hypothetical protein
MNDRKRDESEERAGAALAESPFDEPDNVPIKDFNPHTFSPKDISSMVEVSTSRSASSPVFRTCASSTAAGAGVQRDIVWSILKKHPAVFSFPRCAATSRRLGRNRRIAEIQR